MNWLYLFLAALFGLLLGLFFFGGLWWTIKRLPVFKQPHLVTLASFVIRVVVLLIGFYLVLLWGQIYLVAALFGLLVSRFVLTHKLKP